MEWREQSAVSCDEAYLEAQRWIEVSGEGGETLFNTTFSSLLRKRICEICIFLSNNDIDQSGRRGFPPFYMLSIAV